MQRDMELIRKILMAIESEPLMDRRHEFNSDSELFPSGYSNELVTYHLALLHDGGYVTGNAERPTVSGLTMSGHDFVGCIKDAEIWKKTTERLSDLRGAPLHTYASVAEAEINKRAGL